MGEKNNSKSNEVKVDPVQETKVVSETRKCMIKLSKNKTNIENFIRLQENMAEEAKVITTFLPLNRNTCFQEKEVLEAQTEGDHHIPTAKPKHLFSGKRGIGSTDRR